MRATEFLLEFELPKNKWELVVSNGDKEELGTDLVSLVSHAYSNTPQGSFVNSIKDVIPSDWNVIDWDRDPDVDSCVFYRRNRNGENWNGYKIQGLGHDGTRTSKDKAINKIQELLSKPGVWIESSDAMRHVLKKLNVPAITDERLLQQLFNDPNLKMIDDDTYVRVLSNGQKVQETVFGNPKVRATEFVREEAKAAKYNGLSMKYAFNDRALILKVFAKEGPLAYVKFVKEGDELYPQDLWVNDDYRNRGIAKSMYDYLKSEGYVINRSHDQTKAGAGFWDKHRGEDQYVWEETLSEIGDSNYAVQHVKTQKPSLGDKNRQAKIGGIDFKKTDEFSFSTPDGVRYGVGIRTYKQPIGLGIMVDFYNKDVEGSPYDISGSGNEFGVFSTVRKIVLKYLNSNPKLNFVSFTAKNSEPSRVRLYSAAAKNPDKWFPGFNDVRTKAYSDSTGFLFSKPDPVNEEIIDEMPLPADWDPQEFQQQRTTFKSRLAYALERAKRLGTGSSRVATTIEYQGRQTVLKIAKNQKGLAQNSVEASILEDGYASQLGILIPLIDYDTQHREPLWIHTEMAQKATEKQLCSLLKCPSLQFLVNYATSITGKKRFLGLPQGYQDKLRQSGMSDDDIETCTDYANKLAELNSSFDVELGDFPRAANWGIYQGRPVIIDVGFNSNVYDQYYKPKQR